MTPTKKIISTQEAPAAVGPYAQAVEANGFVFVSGMLPMRLDGTLLDGEIRSQTKQVLANLEAVLKGAGLSLENVVKTTVYLSDMNDFPAMNEIYAEAFKSAPPARATIEVSRLPKGVDVEIEAVAVKG